MPNGSAEADKDATVVVLDMADVIHMARPPTAKTFNEYVELRVEPYMGMVSWNN